MATLKINENCHYVQNDSHKCKIKLEKFHSDNLCRFGVIEESLLGGGRNPPPPPPALVLARSFILSSESYNSVNFSPILTTYVSKSTLKTCLTNDTNIID